MAFLAPFFWALVNIIDIYFVSSVYEDEWDGILINSVFQALPWLLPLFGIVSIQYPGLWASVPAFLGGACLVLSFFYYFKTLFVSNDMVVVQALWNVSVPLVPFLAWIFLGEQLAPVHYAGITLAFFGVMLFSLHEKIKEKNFLQVFKIMMGAVFFFSLSMVLQAEAYQRMDNDFWTGFLIFSAGASITGFLLLFVDPKPLKERTRHLVIMSKTYFFVFFFAESLNLLGVLASQRAIDLTPAVSFVAVIGSLTPVFVLILSAVLLPVLLFMNKSKAHQMYRDQLVAFRTKVLACCIIAVGIYLIS